MQRNHRFVIKSLDEGFIVQSVNKDFYYENKNRQVNIENEILNDILVKATEWKYAKAWFWTVTGDWYIEASSVEDGIRMALACVCSGICDEGRHSIRMLELMVEVTNLVQDTLSKADRSN
jgi:hypothetical protein